MYMVNVTRIGGFALGNAKNVRHLRQKIPTCWYLKALGDAKVLSFALGDAKGNLKAPSKDLLRFNS